MAINLIEAWNVNLAQVFVKFEPSIKISTILNENISLVIADATPTTVDDPFKEIDLAYDYNSVSKSLTLTWNEDLLQPNTPYKIVFNNFRTASNVPIAEDIITFTTDVDVTPEPEDVPAPLPEVQIIDHTLIFDAELSSTSSDEDPDIKFLLVSSDPVNFDAFIPTDYKNGVVALRFNYAPTSEKLTSEYITVQRKPIQRLPSRWEDVSVQIITTANPVVVHLYMPSNDDTPVYNTADKVYYEENYQYRVRLHTGLGVA